MRWDRPDQPQCTARNQRGVRCGRSPIIGGTVCKFHGGGAPQVRRSAALRLIELIDPAIATLAREMVNQRATPGERIRAAENVLDRAGYPRRVTVDTDTARDLLLARLLDMQARRADDVDDEAGHELVQGVLVPTTKENDDDLAEA